MPRLEASTLRRVRYMRARHEYERLRESIGIGEVSDDIITSMREAKRRVFGIGAVGENDDMTETDEARF